ncbi:MAG: twin-arginine translocase subunit TatB [Acidimicrobiia bacterium]|nr:twin-arginine translocase subunit TatB [Acidimicrobiia bacterium]
MFGIGGGEVIVILLVALIVLGPDKLPGAVRKVGQVVSEVRRVSDGFQAEMRTAMLDTDPSRRPQSPPARAVAPIEDDPAARSDADLSDDDLYDADLSDDDLYDADLSDDDLSDAQGPGDAPAPPGGDAGTPT